MIYSYTGDGIQLGQTKREKEELLTTAKLLVEVGLQGCQKKTPVKYKLRVKVVDRPDIILDLLFLLLLYQYYRACSCTPVYYTHVLSKLHPL